mmetsp:Transcript_90530/g.260834  ORF Transcript_90530/g.260834 Transcript_90530/m.260834 type:complete len:607 (-) Transcript_90530:64-1884(-)
MATPSPGVKKEKADGQSGPVSNPLALRHERLQGTISKYVPSSGWGFVKSHLFEGELGFKTESIMMECQNHEFKEGQVVEFDVQSDERGRPIAVALKPLIGKKPSECIGQRHRGYVRRFADRWGFLNSAAFDGDLFVHRDNLLLSPEQFQDGQPPLRSGQAVEFDVALDDRGRTVAKQITTSALPRPCDWIGRRLTGYIRSFQGAWGFINSDRFAGDLFIHSDSILPQYQGIELTVGTMVEFDVERDHHRKGGKNRLVARQVAVLHQPNAMQHQAAMPYGMMPQHYPQTGYGSGLNPGAATFAPMQMYYPNTAQPMTGGLPPDQGHGHLGYQAPYPYADPLQYGAQTGMPNPHMGAPLQQPGVPQYGQPMGTSPYAQLPQPGAQIPAHSQPGMPGQPAYGGQPQLMTQPQPQPQPGYGGPCGQPLAAGGAQPPVGVLQHQQQQPVAVDPVRPAAEYGAVAGTGAVEGLAAGGAEPPQGVLLHITTHDWEPDQSGQLRVRKGTLINVSHRAAHGWVYAATVQPGGETGEPVAEGWVPQAVAKRVSLCRVIVDWPAEGSGTLGLVKGDLIAVSKEAERGWVYGERISPRRPELPSDGWLPKKVLEYIIV